MNRRSFMKTTVVSGAVLATGPTRAAEQTGSSLKEGVHVPAGEDRSKTPLNLGLDRLDAKVSTKDSNGGLYVVEGNKGGKGGPPRHVHHEQDGTSPSSIQKACTITTWPTPRCSSRPRKSRASSRSSRSNRPS